MKLDFYDKEERPWVNPRLTNAAIIGHTTPTTVRLWFRVWKPGDYWLLVTQDFNAITPDSVPSVTDVGEAMISGATVPTVALMKKTFSYQSDLTEVFFIRSLEPGTTYRYALFADQSEASERKVLWELGHDEPHLFSTESKQEDRVCFGLYSCHMPYTKNGNLVNMHLWVSLESELRRADATFAIGAGDQVYSDGQRNISIWQWLRKVKKDLPSGATERHQIMLSWYRDIYRGFWGPVVLRRVLRKFPQYMIWDDHEIMDGWGSYTDKELSNTLDSLWEWENVGKNLALAKAMFKAAKQVYVEYQHSRNPPTPHEVFDYSMRKNGSAFYVLDMRGQRNFNRKSNDKILGAAQMKRFLDWLNSPSTASAPFVFVVSPVPVVHLSNFIANTFDLSLLGLADDLRDEWEHQSNWTERDIILDAVFAFSQTQQKKVVFLSGDVHIGAAFRLSRKESPSAQVYQVTSSGISYASAPGRLLQLATRERGELGHPKKNARITQFVRLSVFNRNNYAILNASTLENRIEVQFFGANANSDEVVKQENLVL